MCNLTELNSRAVNHLAIIKFLYGPLNEIQSNVRVSAWWRGWLDEFEI